jgi:hypothetical protein
MSAYEELVTFVGLQAAAGALIFLALGPVKLLGRPASKWWARRFGSAAVLLTIMRTLDLPIDLGWSPSFTTSAVAALLLAGAAAVIGTVRIYKGGFHGENAV